MTGSQQEGKGERTTAKAMHGEKKAERVQPVYQQTNTQQAADI